MSKYVLNKGLDGKVGYLFVNDGAHPVSGRTAYESAKWMIENDRKRTVRMSEKYPGYPLTSDGVYYFDGEVSDVSACAKESCDIQDEAEIGADGLPIPAGNGKRTRLKKRVKDEVCE